MVVGRAVAAAEVAAIAVVAAAEAAAGTEAAAVEAAEVFLEGVAGAAMARDGRRKSISFYYPRPVAVL